MSASSRSRLACTLTVLVALSLPLSAGVTSPAFAGGRPDLTTTKLVAKPATLLAGEKLKVTDTTTNVGRSKAKASRTSYYLSTNQKYDKRDLVLGIRKVGALKKGAKDTGTVRLRVPAETRARGWYVVACADATRKVVEAKEGNNCRSTKNRITVRPPQPPETLFPMEPDPLSVDSTLQSARASTQMAYAHEPTTITATAADGTTYTLVVPEGALLGPEEITMTPVASVPGLPLSGGLVGGVQIEPHGLLLNRPAQLTIDSPDAGPLSAQTAFLFHEDGADFHQYPMDAPLPTDDADTVRLSLTHFSTPGLGSATPADRANLAERVPARPQAQVEAEISDLLRRERESQENGKPPSPEVTEQVVDVMNRFHDQVIRAQMKAAETNEDLAAEAIAAGLGWSRQVQLLGDEDNPRHAEIMTRVERILRNVMDQNWADCQDHDLSSTLDLIRVARHAALLGYAWQQEAQDKAFGCARFEVRFDSRITSSSSWSGDLQNGTSQGTWRTRGAAHTQLFHPHTTGPLDWAEFSYTMQNTITDPGSTCHLSETGLSTAAGRFRAQATPLLGTLNAYEGSPLPPPVPVTSAVNVVSDDKPEETYRHTSCDGSTRTSTDSRWYWHYEDTGKVWTTDPSQQAEDFIDSKTFTISDNRPGSSRSEVTTVEIWHKPQM